MKAIVHIGMHKTGTSSIQASFAKTPPVGFAYYTMVGPNLNMWARTMFEEDAVRRSLNAQTKQLSDEQLAEQCQQEIDKTDAFLKSCDQDAVILSAERFTYMSDEAVARFADWLKSRFDSIEVYAYVRDPMGFCRSSLQQRIKAISPDLATRIDFPNYRNRFEKFETHFGKDNIHYRLFRRDRLKEHNVVPDFADWIGSSYGNEDIVSENEGMSIEAMSFLIMLNQGNRRAFQTMRGAPTVSQLVSDVMAFEGNKWHYSVEKQNEILAEIGGDCDWMDARLPEPLSRTDSTSGLSVGSIEDFVKIGTESFDAVRDHLLALRFSSDVATTRKSALQNFNILKTDW